MPINVYDFGSVVHLACSFTVLGSPAEPQSLTFEIKNAAGTVTYLYGTDAQIVNDQFGGFYVDWLTTTGGMHYYRWQTFRAAEEGQFFVQHTRFA
jgi:pantothenate kinase